MSFPSSQNWLIPDDREPIILKQSKNTVSISQKPTSSKEGRIPPFVTAAQSDTEAISFKSACIGPAYQNHGFAIFLYS
jgi:hypothetical protein